MNRILVLFFAWSSVMCSMAQLYAGVQVPRRPNAVAPQNKPALQRQLLDLPPLGLATGSTDESILGRLRMLAGVDESLGAILQQLELLGELHRTLVVVTGDHGNFYGEHGLSVELRLAYEEAIRIPLLMRLPSVIMARSEPKEMALTIDLAPSILEIAGAAPLPAAQGRSLVPVLKGKSIDWRSEFLVEHFSDKVFPRMFDMGYQSLRNERWKLIHYTDLRDMDELYDL